MTRGLIRSLDGYIVLDPECPRKDVKRIENQKLRKHGDNGKHSGDKKNQGYFVLDDGSD